MRVRRPADLDPASRAPPDARALGSFMRGARRIGAPVAALCALAACAHTSAPAARGDAPAPVGPGTLIEALSDDGKPLRFRIDSVAPDPRDRDGDVRLYGVSVLEPGATTWRPYCVTDPDGRSAAIPVRGSWSAHGQPEPGAEAITFACTSGAIGKCIRYGYKPWKTERGVSLQPYHAACMHMVRADYCGDGRAHTVDGTWIDVWDDLGIQRREERDGHPEVFEAAWSPSGAAYLNVPRWSDDASDVLAECPERLRGRTSGDRSLLPAEVREQFPDALIFNARYVHTRDRLSPARASR